MEFHFCFLCVSVLVVARNAFPLNRRNKINALFAHRSALCQLWLMRPTHTGTTDRLALTQFSVHFYFYKTNKKYHFTINKIKNKQKIMWSINEITAQLEKWRIREGVKYRNVGFRREDANKREREMKLKKTHEQMSTLFSNSLPFCLTLHAPRWNVHICVAYPLNSSA